MDWIYKKQKLIPVSTSSRHYMNEFSICKAKKIPENERMKIDQTEERKKCFAIFWSVILSKLWEIHIYFLKWYHAVQILWYIECWWDILVHTPIIEKKKDISQVNSCKSRGKMYAIKLLREYKESLHGMHCDDGIHFSCTYCVSRLIQFTHLLLMRVIMNG